MKSFNLYISLMFILFFHLCLYYSYVYENESKNFHLAKWNVKLKRRIKQTFNFSYLIF